MKQLLILLALLFAFFNGINAQNYHEVGIGFSGMRTWEVDPPEIIMQDLDYYYSPNISYRLYFLDEQFSLGASVGLVREVGRKETISPPREEFREDIRKSLIYQITGSVNVFRTRKSFFQISSGVRVTRSYFFKHHNEINEVTETSSFSRSGGFTLDKWSNPNYSLLISVAYQRAMFKKLYASQSLSVRAAWIFMYQLPTYYGSVYGIENEYASIATGPSVSLIWRIKGRKNRGLF